MFILNIHKSLIENICPGWVTQDLDILILREIDIIT